METGTNTLPRGYKLYHFDITVSLHYRVKLKDSTETTDRLLHWVPLYRLFLTFLETHFCQILFPIC